MPHEKNLNPFKGDGHLNNTHPVISAFQVLQESYTMLSVG